MHKPWEKMDTKERTDSLKDEIADVRRQLATLTGTVGEIGGENEFARFEAVHGPTVWDEVLKGRRESEGDPNWRPKSSIEGMAIQSRVRKILRAKLNGGSPGWPVRCEKPSDYDERPSLA